MKTGEAGKLGGSMDGNGIFFMSAIFFKRWSIGGSKYCPLKFAR